MGRVIYMFFFAIFGIQDKNKHIGNCNNIVCPSCGRCQCMKFTNITNIFIYFFCLF